MFRELSVRFQTLFAKGDGKDAPGAEQPSPSAREEGVGVVRFSEESTRERRSSTAYSEVFVPDQEKKMEVRERLKNGDADAGPTLAFKRTLPLRIEMTSIGAAAEADTTIGDANGGGSSSRLADLVTGLGYSGHGDKIVWDYAFAFRSEEYLKVKEGEAAMMRARRDRIAVLSRLKAVGLTISKRITSTCQSKWYYKISCPMDILCEKAEEIGLMMPLTEAGVNARIEERRQEVIRKNPPGTPVYISRALIFTHDVYNRADGAQGFFQLSPYGEGQFTSGERQRIVHGLITGLADVAPSGHLRKCCGAGIDLRHKKLFSRWPHVQYSLEEEARDSPKTPRPPQPDYAPVFNAAMPDDTSASKRKSVVKKIFRRANRAISAHKRTDTSTTDPQSVASGGAQEELDRIERGQSRSTVHGGIDMLTLAEAEDESDAVTTRRKVFLDAIPLQYDVQHAVLWRVWTMGLFRRPFRDKEKSLWSWQQPLDDIRNYYGERIGLYFCWLGFYTEWLWFAGLFGVMGAVMLWSSQGIYTHIALCLYVIVMTSGTEAFLKFWRREMKVRVFRWKMVGYEKGEGARPEFVYENEAKGRVKPSPVTGEIEAFFPTWKRKLLQWIVSWPTIVVLMAVVIIATLGLYTLQSHLETLFGSIWAAVIAGVVNVFVIKIMTIFFKVKVGGVLNNLEHHKTLTDHEDNLIAKTYAFQFINSYFTLFYVSFLKDGSILLDGSRDSCGTSGCLSQLQTMFGLIFFVKVVVAQIAEVLVPLIAGWVKALKTKKKAHHNLVSKWKKKEAMNIEEQLAKPVYDTHMGLMDEYNEMIVQFGYISMFAAAFPLASTIALLNNLVEIRSDSGKLLVSFRRPFYHGVESLGKWESILKFVSWVSIVTNALILTITAETPQAFGLYSRQERMLFLLIAEHVLVAIKYLTGWAIPKTPSWLGKAEARMEYNMQLRSSQSADYVEDGSDVVGLRAPVIYESDEDEGSSSADVDDTRDKESGLFDNNKEAQ